MVAQSPRHLGVAPARHVRGHGFEEGADAGQLAQQRLVLILFRQILLLPVFGERAVLSGGNDNPPPCHRRNVHIITRLTPARSWSSRA